MKIIVCCSPNIMEALYLQWWRFLLWLCSFSPFVFQYSIWILLPISFVFQIFVYVHVYIRFCSYLYVQSKFEASTCTGSVLNNKNTSVCVVLVWSTRTVQKEHVSCFLSETGEMNCSHLLLGPAVSLCFCPLFPFGLLYEKCILWH